MGDKLHLQDCKCPICMCILIEPVRMPCSHELCMPCFRQNVQEAHFTCPICRLRISSWARKHSRLGQLVDETRWKQIKEAFPRLCQKRLDGDDEDSEYEESPVKINIHVAQPGEIRKEYEEERSKFQKIRELEEMQATEQSEELIKHLQKEDLLRYEENKTALKAQQHDDEELAKHISAGLAEEEQWKTKQEQTLKDEELARQLQEEDQSPSPVVDLSGPSTSSQRGQTPSMKCTRLEHLFSKMERRKVSREGASHDGEASPSIEFGAFSPARLPSMDGVRRPRSPGSEDSITTEVCHFKPIATSPRTARRRLADGTRESPPIVHSTPRNLSNMADGQGSSSQPEARSRLVEMLSRKMPATQSEPSSKLRLSKEVQASPAKSPQTIDVGSGDEASEAAGVGSREGNGGPADREGGNRQISIKSKLSKYSRSGKEGERGFGSRFSGGNKQCKSDTRRKKGIFREEVREPRKSLLPEGTSNPRKRCKADSHLRDYERANVHLEDENANSVLMRAGHDPRQKTAPANTQRDRQSDNGDGLSSPNLIHSLSPPRLHPKEEEDLSDGPWSDGGGSSSSQSSFERYMELLSEEQRKLRQEAIDRQVALDLQREFEEESRTLPVVRTKGSEDAYPLRTSRKRVHREISPSPEA